MNPIDNKTQFPSIQSTNNITSTPQNVQSAASSTDAPQIDVFDGAIAKRPAQKTAFAAVNENWFTKSSDKMHASFQKKPEDWHSYHAMFRDARKTWEATPADEMIRYYAGKDHAVIGDFGCGEGMIGKALAGRHTVYSFDHVAANDSVTACDIAHVPLKDGALDVAIFSLALMGDNFTQYVDEAHRALSLGGTLHIIEMSRRFTDKQGFLDGLKAKGFEIDMVEDMWKFTHVQARKTAAELQSSAQLVF